MDITSLIAPCYYEAYNDFWAETYREQWFAGGRGSGKSSFISILVVLGVMAHPEASAICFRKIGSDLKDSVYNQIVWAIDMLGLTSEFRYGLSPLKITRKRTGQVIMFYGLDDPAKRKSIKCPHGYFRFLWLEELDQYAGMAELRSVRQSVLRGGEIFQSFYSFNPPEAVTSWVNAEAKKVTEGRMVYRSNYLDIPVEWLGSQFVEEAEALRRDNFKFYQHEYLGKATGTGGEVFTNVVDQKISDEQIKNFKKAAIAWGMDFGFTNDPSTLIGTFYDTDKKTLYIFHEWYAHGQFTDDIAKAIKERKLTEAAIVADSAEPRVIAELNSSGCHVHGCYKASGFREDGYRWLRSRHLIVIDSTRCPNAWREFSTREYGRYADGTLRSDYPDGDDHTIDAVRYSRETEIRYGAKALAWLGRR